MKPASLAIDVGGRPLVLSSLCKYFDPVSHALFLDDAEFGKHAVFRARGTPVRTGSTADNLLRIDRLIAEFEPAMLVFPGNLLHARESLWTPTPDALHATRARHASMSVGLGEGNHDRHTGASPHTLAVEAVREPWHVWTWALCHHPRAVITRRGSPGMCIRSIRSRRGPSRCVCRALALGSIGGCCLRSGVLLEARVRRGALRGQGYFLSCRRE